MESKKLEALLMAADLGSFTKAAEVLGYTQSGLTHMMNSLEKEVGFPLLERGRYGVRLTEEGIRLEGAIREFLQANARLDNTIMQIGAMQHEVLRVSAYASIAMHWLPSIVQSFRERCPDVDVDIRIADDVDSPYDLLAQRKMDVVFVSWQNKEGFDWLHLTNDRMYAILPRDYPVDGRSSFPLKEFDGKQFIMPSQGFDRDVMRIFNSIDVHADIGPTRVDDPTVISMVEHGLGVSMMTELTIKGRANGVAVLPVEPASSRELGIALRSNVEMSPSLRRFIGVAQSTVARLTAE